MVENGTLKTSIYTSTITYYYIRSSWLMFLMTLDPKCGRGERRMG